jgi:hypothetical protein
MRGGRSRGRRREGEEGLEEGRERREEEERGGEGGEREVHTQLLGLVHEQKNGAPVKSRKNFLLILVKSEKFHNNSDTTDGHQFYLG